MNADLAERLLAAVMEWTPEEHGNEWPKLADLAYYRYDQYQQFSPGMRFIESLALWLEQFQPGPERRLAYRFARDRLVFISQTEMAHLVSMVYPDLIQGILLDEVARLAGLPAMRLRALRDHQQYEVLRRRSLFLGLSDGARMDVFRRSAPELSNEQIWLTYEISRDKAEDMRQELRSDLTGILSREPSDDECKFRMVFLLDDFTASGISYFRKEDDQYKGKLVKTLKTEELNGLVSTDVTIYVVFYLATAKAEERIRSEVAAWCNSQLCGRDCRVKVIYRLPPDIHVLPGDSSMDDWLAKYTDDSIVDRHFRKGRYDQPYLGFDACGLPLVLHHNTPNNSLPVLWQEESRMYRGLFPRVSRHGRNL